MTQTQGQKVKGGDDVRASLPKEAADSSGSTEAMRYHKDSKTKADLSCEKWRIKESEFWNLCGRWAEDSGGSANWDEVYTGYTGHASGYASNIRAIWLVW